MAELSSYRRTGQAGELWPVFLLLLLVAVPTIAVLWFVGVAMDNQQLATQQRLSDAYRLHLQIVKDKVESEWADLLQHCDETVVAAASPQEAFETTIKSNQANSLVIYASDGTRAYPNSLSYSNNEESGPLWRQARDLENFSGRPLKAYDLYARIANESENEREKVAAIQAQLRCLLEADERGRATEFVSRLLKENFFDSLENPHAKSIAVNVQLMSLEQLESTTDKAELRDRLIRWALDYADEAVAAPQRLFVMRKLAASFPQLVDQRLIRAEAVAAAFGASANASLSPTSTIRRADGTNLWYATSPSGRCVLLIEQDLLESKIRSFASETAESTGAHLQVLPPGREPASQTLLSTTAGTTFPGWRLALSLRDAAQLDASQAERNRILWTGCLVVLSTSILAFFSVRAFRRHLQLANFKNNLVGTVSHELKTPLSSMRLLVDTLLDEETLDEQTTREYLHLISKENQRLSRLIETFLTFSRIERGKLALDLHHVAPKCIVEMAVEAAGERFQAADCELRVSIAENLPNVFVDQDGMVTVLLNLLDNAHKYSEPIRQIDVTVADTGDGVAFAVADNGIGISRSARRRVFQRFFQVDRGLSRIGEGCGLGLSIVQSIVAAHSGHVALRSDLGRGSCFTVTIPASNDSRKEENRE